MTATAKSAAAVAAACALLAGCATTDKFSYLESYRYYRADMHSYDATIVSVDGEHHLLQRPARVEPGFRKIVVQAPPARGFRFGEQRTIEMNIEPCKRYYFAAVKKNPLAQDFEPRVDYVEDLAGCGVSR